MKQEIARARSELAGIGTENNARKRHRLHGEWKGPVDHYEPVVGGSFIEGLRNALMITGGFLLVCYMIYWLVS